jgi:plasmid stabilization system protein ParE
VIRARFHRAALDEIETDWARYADIDPKLGDAFVDSIEQALNLAREFPEMGSPYRYGTRRVFPKRFPYSLIYVHRNDEVFVVALAPFRRRPTYWRSRVNEG